MIPLRRRMFPKFLCPNGGKWYKRRVTVSRLLVKLSNQLASQSDMQLSAPQPSSPPAPALTVLSLYQPFSLCLSPGQLFNHSASLSLSPDAPKADLLSCPRMRCSDVPASALRLSLSWCVCAPKRLQGSGLPGAGSCCFLQLAAVLGGGTTAQCRGGEAARWPCCCCCRAEPAGGPRPGRIMPLLLLWIQGLLKLEPVLGEATLQFD